MTMLHNPARNWLTRTSHQATSPNTCLLQRMQTPRTPEELAATVELQSDLTVEESIQRSPWASAFNTRLPDEEMRLLFTFLILCVALQSKDKEKQEIALNEIHDRVFSNNQTWIANISFRDTENVVEDIFKFV